MSIEKFVEPYGNASIIFDPIPSYSGDWLFKIENLIKNSKKDNNINFFEKFYKTTYQEPLMRIFNTSKILDLPVRLFSTPNDNNIGRCLKYSKIDFFIELTCFLNDGIFQYGKTKEEYDAYITNLVNNIKADNDTLNLAYAEALKEKSIRLKDLLDKEINSEYFEAAMKDYAVYKDRIDFTTYIKSLYKITNDFQIGMLKLGDFFDHNIDYQALANCFDPDTFYLLFAKIIYEVSLESEKRNGLIDNSYGYLYFYEEIIRNAVKEDKKYSPKILFTLPSGKKIRYTRWDFQHEFKELLERHPEAQKITLPHLSDDNRYKDIELIEKLSDLYGEDTQVNWEFLPEGVGIKKGANGSGTVVEKKVKKDKSELIEETNMRINILENSGFIGRPVKGLNTFDGYYAFIYPNGKVILEKFWENEETMNPAEGAATYVMNIDNFIEMSKLSRLTLIEYIKTLPEIGVKRIFHTSINNWQRNLYNEITGTYRLEDAIDFISGLKSGAITNE